MKRHLEYPDCSIYDLIKQKAAETADLCALSYFGRKISYRRLIAETDKCARALDAFNVKKGDIVSLCLPNIPEAIYLFYAINKVGAVANMIHPMSAENEIVRFVQLTDSRLIFGVDLIGEKLEKVQKKCPDLQVVTVSISRSMPLAVKLGYSFSGKCPPKTSALDWSVFSAKSSIGREISEHSSADETAAILYSGGTTGRPKGIMLTNLNFNALTALMPAEIFSAA